jgi:hypothetical protein
MTPTRSAESRTAGRTTVEPGTFFAFTATGTTLKGGFDWNSGNPASGTRNPFSSPVVAAESRPGLRPYRRKAGGDGR